MDTMIYARELLLNPEDLIHHAQEIAKNQDITQNVKSVPYLIKRLKENYNTIKNVYKQLNRELEKGHELSYASQWLMDNYYKIEEQYGEVILNLNKSKFLKLDVLSFGYLQGYPRAYAIAYEFISHRDGVLDENLLVQFIQAYQKEQVLGTDEIWSLSLMLRCALIDDIKNICLYIANDTLQGERAEETLQSDNIMEQIKCFMVIHGDVNDSYIEHLLRLMRRQGMETGEIAKSIENKLQDYNTAIYRVIERQHKEQAQMKISIGNALTSLGRIATLDWNSIFEKMSLVEEILKKDPSGIYTGMDFESRDYYRSTIVEISKKLKEPETRVARKSIECATQFNNIPKKNHVGYYLVDKGRLQLYSALGSGKRYESFHNKSLGNYLIPVFLILIILESLIFMFLRTDTSIMLLGLLLLTLIIPLSEVSISLVNYIYSNIIKPAFLPRMELKNGIDESLKTLVVIPALIPDISMVSELIAKLEVYYHANKESNIFFSVAGDFIDSCSKQEIQDDKIIETAKLAVNKLNSKYGKNIFFYFHRERTHNPIDNKWMGWERKRGALVELNRMLLGNKNTSYKFTFGDIKVLQDVQYVITIDADTQLTLGTAKKLIGICAHPLNKPIVDNNSKKVIEGYGLVQPRIGMDLDSVNKNSFTKIFGGLGGVDTYSTANSNIYQDLFGIGIFSGKGIYHLPTFYALLDQRFPDNRILSHDLLEGSYMRTGLATDFELLDSYPSKYSSYMKRNHRWTRGDWQVIPWIGANVLNSVGNKEKNPLTCINKWQIMDNLRRSLYSFFVLLVFCLSFVLERPVKALWIIILIFLCPLFIRMIEYIKNKYYQTVKHKFNCDIITGFKLEIFRSFLSFMFLPYEAYMTMDAILRTVYRLVVSKKNMLQWVTAADAEKTLSNDFKSYIKRMKSTYIIGLLLLLLIYAVHPKQLTYGIILFAAWSLGPYMAYSISKNNITQTKYLSVDDRKYLMKIARKTWAYFSTTVTEENNYLPPDNFQEFNNKGAANRTSPTNIGLYLLSVITARDFGNITLEETLCSIERTLKSIKEMSKWKGHLYNWYDTISLEVLRPLYVSTVDSGNFISYLIPVKEALIELINKPIISEKDCSALATTLSLSETEFNENQQSFIISYSTGEKPFDITQFVDFIDNYKIDSDEEMAFWQEQYIKMINNLKKDLRRYILPLNNTENVYNLSLIQLKDLYVKYLDKDNDTETRQLLTESIENIEGTVQKINRMVFHMEEIISDTNFAHLYDEDRNLFSIGYSVEDEKLSNSYYDLLASESRTTSYLAIVKGNIPQKHWLKLGRAMTVVDGYRGLVSWTGTMFEYFMPYLLMKNYNHSLMYETYFTTLRGQIEYAAKRGTPWGISESGYYAFDMAFNYQYKAFGVPDLGLKRGLSSEVVVSPYSTFLALPLSPEVSMKNIKVLLEQGMEGRYGFYEAMDYTPSKAYDKGPHIIHSYMTHHQGMILNSINNYFNNFILQTRFHSDAAIKAGEVLLQEKIPLRVILAKEIKEEISAVEKSNRFTDKIVRNYSDVQGHIPQCHILSNGTYTTMINSHGGGYSTTGCMQITRWREDPLRKKNGLQIFIRHLNTNTTWSMAYDLLDIEPDAYKVSFYPEKAEISRRDEEFDSFMEVYVSPEDNVEIRKIKITNHSDDIANIEVTSYLELVLTDQHGDLAHPAFSNLFVRTEFNQDLEGLIASRRPRNHDGNENWIFHSVKVDEGESRGLQFETIRDAFIGRGNDLSNAVALKQPLKDTSGIVLDPILSLRKSISVHPGSTIEITYTTGIHDTREELVKLMNKYRDYNNVSRAMELSNTRSQIEQNYLNIDQSDMIKYQEMISSIIYLDPNRRNMIHTIDTNENPQKYIWRYGLSGEIPMILIVIDSIEDIYIIKKMIKAHEYWRMKGLLIDLVILNMEENNYYQPLSQLINEIVSASPLRYMMDQQGGIHIKNNYSILSGDIPLIYSAARIIINGKNGISKNYFEDYNYNNTVNEYSPLINDKNIVDTQENLIDVQFFNGFGGFSKDGLSYIIQLKGDMSTPAPWINVIANKKFGFTISENGGGFIWCDNSRENKLTPWYNDAVTDEPGEIIYIKDNDDHKYWSVTSSPIRASSSYTIEHGMGYTTITQESNKLEHTLTLFVPEEDSVKISILKLKNDSMEKRNLTLVYYIRPVLGVVEAMTQQYLNSLMHEDFNMVTVRNPYNNEYNNKLAFVSSSEKIISYTTDRIEFIGLHGSIKKPYGLQAESMSNSSGSGYDPCIAIEISIVLEENEEKEIVFLMGQGEDITEVKECIDKYSVPRGYHNELARVKEKWRAMTGNIQIETPDDSMNIIVNGWLLYQALSCRIWARSAFYQSGGAYGFRDQLQDAMNLLYTLPQVTRDQIILHSAHQFSEGDVQHWWHPGIEDKGIRTRFSDDLLWLPYSVVKYIKVTGDEDLLNHEVPFLEEDELKEGEDEKYGSPRISDEKGTIYEHCVRAIDRSMKLGEQGIPLMGSGDWNDGMNTVGNKGKGQSVWLGWFLYDILDDFIHLCEKVGDIQRKNRYSEFKEKLKKDLNTNAWDGQWYLRGFYDDGSPLGSSQNMECKIDSLGQSWAVISNAGEEEKIHLAMDAVEEYLIRRNEGLVLLFTPPFDNSDQKPGYIKGYVPGVRENGGQYTHAAAWVIKAFAMMGEGNKAVEIYHMINPVNHTRTQLECSTYKVEPYVMSADVYAVNPHVGRGGWSWYTGVAGWMYSVALEDILGIRKNGDRMTVEPSIPSQWNGFTIHYRYGDTMYHINVKRENQETSQNIKIYVDGSFQEYISLEDDGEQHQVEVRI